jgi:hypothetical protein
MAKKIIGEFETREITCSIFEYTLQEFKKLKANKVMAEWEEDLNDNSSSYPVYEGSPFDKNGLSLPKTIDEEPDDETIYVVPHYFYSSAEYSIETDIESNCEIKLAPIVGVLMAEGPMDFAEKNGEQIYFEGQGATDGSEFAVNFFKGNKLIGTSLLADIDDDFLCKISTKFEN